MTIYAGHQDGQIFTKNGNRRAFEWLVIARNPRYINLPGNEDKHEWQALSWSETLTNARKYGKTGEKNYYQVEIIPVFEKSAVSLKILKEDLDRQKRAQEEGRAAYEASRAVLEADKASQALEARIDEEALEDLRRITDEQEALQVAEEEAARQTEERAKQDQEEAEPAPEEEDPLLKVDTSDLDIDEALRVIDEHEAYMDANRDRILAEIREEDKQTPEERKAALKKIDEENAVRGEQPEKLGPVPYAPSLICKRCGKLLTGQESIDRGYGDKCWRKVWKFVRGTQEPEAPQGIQQNNPASITDPDTAFKTRLEIKRRIDCSEETCLCGEKAEGAPVFFYDHEGGYMIPGYKQPQWVYTVCPKCGYQYSLRKMRSIDIEDLETEGRREAGQRLAEEEAAKAAKKQDQPAPLELSPEEIPYKILKQYSTGDWTPIEPDQINSYINRILERETWLAARLGRDQMTTAAQVIDYLKTGKRLKYDDEWYAVIKMDLPKKPAPPVEMVKCDCGHTVPRCSVMSASVGTSCPECYDRMSM